MTATPPKDSDHRETDTAHGMDVSSFHSQAPSSLNHLAYGVYWRSRAGNLLPVRRWKRRPVDALVRKTLYERGVAVGDSANPDFGKKGRPPEGGTAPIGSASTPTDKKRKSFSPSEKNRLWNGTYQSASPRLRRR